MSLGQFGIVAALSGVTIASGTLGVSAQPHLMRAETVAQAERIAQTDTGCRQTNAVTGVYAQPDLSSVSQGILTAGQTVQLELLGSGTGWVRINQPLIGWVEARYLTPATPCTAFSSTTYQSQQPIANSTIRALPQSAPTQSIPQSEINSTQAIRRPELAAPALPVPQIRQPTIPQPAIPQSTTAAVRPTSIVTVVCEVYPAEGLVVRTEPNTAVGTGLYTIPQGVHTFQFTGVSETTPTPQGLRRWSYIVAPYEGWISVGVVGGGYNIGGNTCG